MRRGRFALLVLVAAAIAGSSLDAPERREDDLRVTLAERIEAATAALDVVPELLFERVQSRASDGDREVAIRVRRGFQGPLREGFFVYVNQLEVTLEDVRIDVTDRLVTARSPLEVLGATFHEAIAGLLDDRAPREYTLQTLPDAVLERSVGRVVLAPFEARVVAGGQTLSVRARSAMAAPDAVGLVLAGATVTTSGGDRLDAEEAVLGRDGALFVMSGYRHAGATPAEGDSATFAVTPDGRRLANQGPVPVGALVASEASVGLAVAGALAHANPALQGVFPATMMKRRGR